MPTRKIDGFDVNTARGFRQMDFIEKWEEYHAEQSRNGGTRNVQDRWWYEFKNSENLYLAFHHSFPESHNERDKKEDKKKFLDAICDLAPSLSSANIEACKDRLNALVRDYKQQGWEISSASENELSTQWRLVVGLGSESVLESSMTLHHLYGFPHIPATALKGIARAFALYEEGRACENADKRLNPAAQVDSEAQEVFGTQNQAGKVIFFDAYPTEFPKLEVDVINVHYQDYYSKGDVPGDWMSPVPSFFLTVAPKTRFNFYLASRNEKLLKLAKDWLYNGLTQLGIGGKTNAGYGYFRESRDDNADAEVATEDLKHRLSQSGFKVSSKSKRQ